MVDDKDSSGPISEQVARAVKRLREEQRLPYTELSERLAKMGRPIPVLGLRRIERGERRVDVDDLMALARVLGVPPLMLLMPVGTDGQIEVIPGRRVSTWEAAQWVTGESPFPGSADEETDDFNAWHRGGLPLELYRQHDELCAAWNAEVKQLIVESSKDEQRLLPHERALGQLRRQMRRRGVLPPDLPPELADRGIDALDAGTALYRRDRGGEE